VSIPIVAAPNHRRPYQRSCFRECEIFMEHWMTRNSNKADDLMHTHSTH
jgi:hypothetical protein